MAWCLNAQHALHSAGPVGSGYPGKSAHILPEAESTSKNYPAFSADSGQCSSGVRQWGPKRDESVGDRDGRCNDSVGPAADRNSVAAWMKRSGIEKCHSRIVARRKRSRVEISRQDRSPEGAKRSPGGRRHKIRPRTKRKKTCATVTRAPNGNRWCQWPDSNRHGGLARRILNPLRLPISPHWQSGARL